jgi:hypothetical protein
MAASLEQAIGVNQDGERSYAFRLNASIIVGSKRPELQVHDQSDLTETVSGHGRLSLKALTIEQRRNLRRQSVARLILRWRDIARKIVRNKDKFRPL